MPKYLIEANYVGDGIRGLLADGGSKRRAEAERLVEALGGTLELFCYAFGDTDLYAVAELPDHQAAGALALTVAASGRVATRTVVLLSPEEVDGMGAKSPDYSPPGG